MLRFTHRPLFSFSLNHPRPHRFSKMYTFKPLKYVREEDFNWLANRFERNMMFRDRIDYLRKLQSEGTLKSFYSNKQINTLKDEDIYYLLTSGMEYSLSKDGQKELFDQINSTYFKCLCSKEFGWLDMVSQFRIIFNFNKEVLEMTPEEMTFCLEIISQFQQTKNQLDNFRIKSKISALIDNSTHPNLMITICGYLLKINIFYPAIVDAYLLQKWYVSHKSFEFKSIFFLHKLYDKLMIPISQQKKKQLNNVLRTAITKMQFKIFQEEYLLFLLKQYPEHVATISTLHFTPRAYIGYLQFYIQHPEYKLAEHIIPNSVIELADFTEFRTIIDCRISLLLDNVLTLAKNLSFYFSYSLKPVNCYLNFLRENKVDDLEVLFIVERTVAKKLKLFTQLELNNEFSIEQTIFLLVNLSRFKLCSVDFWKKAVKKLQKLIERNFETKIIQTKIEPYINLLYLVSLKNFKQETRVFIYNQIVSLLRDYNVYWSLHNYLKLIRVLDTAKIGQYQIWILIQIRIEDTLNKIKPQDLVGQHLQMIMYKLAVSFSMMDKGSHKFWSLINNKLENQTKKKVLQKFKTEDSLAHSYLKLTPVS